MKKDLFDLSGKKVLITGAGFLSSTAFAPAILDYGGTVILVDIDEDKAKEVAKKLNEEYGDNKVIPSYMDITKKETIEFIVSQFEKIDVVINAACNNPKQSKDSKSITNESRFENFSLDKWNKDIEVGLTGSFLTSQILGNHFISKGGGKIINIGSDLALMQQNHNLYRKDNFRSEDQPVKDVSYSVLKAGLVSLTKYMASYPRFNEHNVRINCVCPGPIYNSDMTDDFVDKLKKTIPIGRLGRTYELKGIIVYLCSDSSNYMQGSIISIDGGRTLL